MSNMKQIVLVVILIASFLLFSHNVFAADVNISCDAEVCTPQTVSEFFSSSFAWAPGTTFSKSIAITNKSKKKFPVVVQASSPQTTGNLDMVIQFTITSSNGVTLWDGPLHSFYTYGPIEVSNNLLPGKTQTYTFTAYMYESADDQYQGKETTFNMTIGNYIYVPTTPVPCVAPKPAKPGWFNVSKMSSTDVILYWGSISPPYTGFTVSWGTDQNATSLGTKNIGKTNEILLSGFDLDRRLHYYKVRTMNECAASDYTSILSVGGVPTPTPKPNTPTPTATKAQSIPGSTITSSQTTTPSLTLTSVPSVSPPPTVSTALIATDGAVLGAATTTSNPADLIPLFVGASTATLFTYWIYSKLFV
jgi:hypothetical protein